MKVNNIWKYPSQNFVTYALKPGRGHLCANESEPSVFTVDMYDQGNDSPSSDTRHIHLQHLHNGQCVRRNGPMTFISQCTH